ncbi:dehydrogenase [Synechococcus phage Bellamy]|uniref:Glucose 6 phosphate dehydrogenase n=1 Tax=Synechococcus phage Bellamy TaxID=2023996 RepID=A0A222YYZ2_9CAUD|nr:dehydrogenase [Synechococcus phage Bellamy]ASR76284.1 glucose 6 phosphate dehydrogenase [Synechococcus phage Bellamy]
MELPTKTLVIFGATGDLCRRKLIPALETLHKKGLLPDNFKIIGAARRENTRQSWLDSLGKYYEADFSLKLDYHRCDLSDVDSLRSIPVSDDMTFFLSVPPDRYSDAIQNLKSAGLVDDPEKSRVIIEKPFGTDLESANHLQSVVAGCLREKQVYRIDHYLGKDTVNNILATRFSNTLLEPLWNRNYIEEVQIFATETIGCEGRSQYYDGAGVVRDMLQNHMLQILSLIAMDAPCRNDAKEIRREKVKVLAATRLGHKVVFGQYESYKSEEGVDTFSETPTYVAGDIYIDNWRWKGVPFHFMSGKKMPYTCTEVVIKLKAPPIGLFDGHEFNDRIVMRFQPNPHLDIRIDMKSPGLDDKVQTATLTHPYPEGAIDGYVKLFYDSLNGDQSHFVHAEEVLESWRIVDDLLCVGDKCPIRTAPFIYTGGWGPTHKTQFITKWDYPA